MEELKVIVEIVKDLPSTALWMLFLYFGYKVLCVGSAFALLRFTILKAHDLICRSNSANAENIESFIDTNVIDGTQEYLINQLERLKSQGNNFIHHSNVAWLERAIDDREEKESI